MYASIDASSDAVEVFSFQNVRLGTGSRSSMIDIATKDEDAMLAIPLMCTNGVACWKAGIVESMSE